MRVHQVNPSDVSFGVECDCAPLAIGIESITAAGLKGMYKGLNLSGDDLATIPVRFQAAIAPGFRFNPDSEVGDDAIKSAEGRARPMPQLQAPIPAHPPE